MERVTFDEMVLAGLASPSDASVSVQVARQLIQNESSASRFRKQFLERLPALPPQILEAVQNGRMQLSDAHFYKVATVTGTATDVFSEDDKIQVGICNFAESRLDPNRPFVLSAISLQYSASLPGVFDSAEIADEIRRAEWELRYDSKDIYVKMPVDTTFTPVVSNYKANDQYGLYELNNPKLFLGGQRIEFKLRMPAAFAAGDHSVKITLIGTTVAPY